ncbi:MAG: lysostaphin resistance A-like protein [Peptoniphilaceae bacterium]
MEKSKNNKFLILIYSFIGIVVLFYGINYFSKILLKISPFDTDNIFLSRFILCILLLIISIILSEKIFNYKVPKSNIRYDKYKMFCIMTFSIVIIQIITFIIYKYVRLWPYEIRYDANNLNNFNIILSFITACILTPWYEEIFFRKIVFSILYKRNIKPTSIILFSGIIFGIIHFSALSSAVNATIGGTCFAYIYYKTQNIIFPILGHSINNLSTYASSIFYYFKFGNNLDLDYIERYGEDLNFISSIAFMTIICIISFIVYYIISIKKKNIN